MKTLASGDACCHWRVKRKVLVSSHKISNPLFSSFVISKCMVQMIVLCKLERHWLQITFCQAIEVWLHFVQIVHQLGFVSITKCLAKSTKWLCCWIMCLRRVGYGMKNCATAARTDIFWPSVHRRRHSLESGTVGGLGDFVPQKLKHFYNCDVELWANFIVYFCFSVFYF